MTQSQHALRWAFLAAILAISACAPDLGIAPGQDQGRRVTGNEWPELLTSDMIASLRARDPDALEALLASIEGVEGRAAALRLRAAALQNPVLTPSERRLLTDATQDNPS